MSRDLGIYDSNILRKTLHLGCCQWWLSGCARSVFSPLSLVLDECFRISVCICKSGESLDLTKIMTSLCSVWASVSGHSIVSAVAGCLVFLRSQWVLFAVDKSFVRLVWASKFQNVKAVNIFCNFDQRFVCHSRISSFFSGPLTLSTCFGL